MINHIRTLLLNRDPEAIDTSAIGHEFVPPEFRAVPLPQGLLSIRTVLFGSRPDSFGMNYRLRQFMPFLHSANAEQHTLKPDKRTTYLNSSVDFFQITYGVTTIPKLGTPLVSVGSSGEFRFSDTNTLEQRWRGSVVSAPSGTSENGVVELVAGVSDPVPLPGMKPLYLKLMSGNAGDTFEILLRQRPAVDLAALPAQLAPVLTPEVQQALFGLPPYETPFRQVQLWSALPQLQFQLAGVLLALAYRTDKLRRGE